MKETKESVLSNLDPGTIELLLKKLIDLEASKEAKVQKKPKLTKQRKRKREPKVGIYVLIPSSLYAKLKSYVNYHSESGETMTDIIVAGIEKELKERYQKKLDSLKNNILA